MNFCTECGEKLPSRSKFCPGCGASTLGLDARDLHNPASIESDFKNVEQFVEIQDEPEVGSQLNDTGRQATQGFSPAMAIGVIVLIVVVFFGFFHSNSSPLSASIIECGAKYGQSSVVEVLNKSGELQSVYFEVGIYDDSGVQVNYVNYYGNIPGHTTADLTSTGNTAQTGVSCKLDVLRK